MGRVFHIPGIFFLFCAFVLLLLVSISLPYLTALDVVRVHFDGGRSSSVDTVANAITQLRFGIWADCWYSTSGDRVCATAGLAYNATIYNSDRTSSVAIGSSWTRGLAIHPVATGVALIAFLLSLSAHITSTLLASLAAFLAGLIALIAFAVDIALYAYVKHEMGKLSDVSATTDTAPAFWMTFAAMLLLWLAGGTVCLGRRRDRMAGATTYPLASSKASRSWRSRFGKA